MNIRSEIEESESRSSSRGLKKKCGGGDEEEMPPSPVGINADETSARAAGEVGEKAFGEGLDASFSAQRERG
ncbi:hypothetical protein DL771_006698 [Monosporascus sp. 5C6A]|nr:hypothetical protein DL771_006698 [Monosporascus sp. 5C6A]